jgi:molecular chaperone GrpE
MSEENNGMYKIRVSQKAIIHDRLENKYLILKANDQGHFYKKYGPWELAGGRIEEREDFIKSFRREIAEEMGDIEFEIISLIDNYKVEGAEWETIFLGYLVEYKSGEIKLSDEHSEYKWVTAEDVEKNSEYKPWLKQFVKKATEYLEKEKAMDNWKRCQADFENYKKDQVKAMGEFRKFASLDMIMQILPVLDNFNASLKHVPEDQKDNAWVTGINYIQKQLEDVLKNNGIEEINVKIGDEFNPEMHEAVKDNSNDENEHSNDLNVIKKVVQKGYKIDGKVIRAVRAIVN